MNAFVREKPHGLNFFDQVATLRAAYDLGKTRDMNWRQRQLTGLLRFCWQQRRPLLAAMKADLGKPANEAMMADVAAVAMEVVSLKLNLRRWVKPQSVSTPLPLRPATSSIVREPLGVVLIIGAWNYPVQLTLLPLAGALAAGNCALVKPSEIAAQTSRLLAEKLPEYLDKDYVQVIEGGPDETQALLRERFDHIFYTGNGAVARLIMKAASENLTPVTLELGGKSPCLVDRDADLEITARRIALGKWMNAGQTCIAPDYILAHHEIADALVEKLGQTIREFYGSDPQKSPAYARIVNEHHVERLSRLLQGTDIAHGGKVDLSTRYVAPTVLKNVSSDAPVMQEEIFGPLLPVLPVRDMGEAVAFVRERPKPLALYLFTRNRAVEERVLADTSSGGVSINHTVLHAGNPNLPFGGVGPSGTGAYHGRRTFQTFTHEKAVLKKPFRWDWRFFYPRAKNAAGG
ncbi:MAG: aldehyde dehydrogenase family protein [Bdellovibrionota bacterium]